ncbi:MAG: hypothetical protein ACRC2J_18070 [Microcoleaceae cyanobacterium]
MQTTKIFKTVFSTTVLLASMASASQAQLGCPFSKKSAGNTVFQKSLNINSFNSTTNPSLLQNKGVWFGAGAIGLLGAGSVALFLKKRAITNINLDQEINQDVNTNDLYLPENGLDNNLDNLVVSHPEAPGGDLDVSTNLTYEEKAVALTK